jgi:lipid-binding SYLF domain-containing protein
MQQPPTMIARSSKVLVTIIGLSALAGCSDKTEQSAATASAVAESKAPAVDEIKTPAAPELPPALLAAVKSIPDEKTQLSVQSTLVDFFSSAPTHPFFAKNYGCVVFPTIGKGGIGIGGAHGSGWVFQQNALAGTAKMTQVTIGLQAGGQAFSQIIFLEDQRAYDKFTSGNFELGAQASAVALSAGANASASTAGGAAAGSGDTQVKTTYTDGLAIFTKAKGGLMYEASVGGQKFKFEPTK